MIIKCAKCRSNIELKDDYIESSITCSNCAHVVKLPVTGTLSGKEIGGYKVSHRIGIGGMGEVWLAEQLTSGQKAAVKILSPKMVKDDEFIDRFIREIRNSSKFKHPNIVAAFDGGKEHGLFYLASSYIEGINVENKLIEEVRIPERIALQITYSIALALKYVWSEFKTLHRDIKPGNIIIDKNGDVYLTDMGIAKCLSDDTKLTMTGFIIGTPCYISPEQAKGDKDIDFRADMYSLGATLFHMVTGTVPFPGKSPAAIIAKHIQEKPPVPKELYPKLSCQCSALIEKMLAKDKSQRFASWDDLIKEIDIVLQQEKNLTIDHSKKNHYFL